MTNEERALWGVAELFINHHVEHPPGQGALAENFHVPCVYERVCGREEWLGEGRAHRPPAGRTCFPHARTRAARRGHTRSGAQSRRKRGATAAARLGAARNPVTLPG